MSFDELRDHMSEPDILKQRARANWSQVVPEIVFALWLCDGYKSNRAIEVIAAQAVKTYPRAFYTRVEGKKTPDLSLIHLALREAKKAKRGFVSGDWYRGWKLTRRGSAFAKDIERRAKERKA